jgi:hypothetical protein
VLRKRQGGVVALFAPFYNVRGKARNFFVTRRVLCWTAWVLGRNDAERGASHRGHEGHREGTTDIDLGAGTWLVADRLESVPKVGGGGRRILRKVQRVSDVADFITPAVRRDWSLVQNFHRIKDHDRSAVGTIHDVDPRVCLGSQPGLFEHFSQNRFLQRFTGAHLPARKSPKFLTSCLANQQDPRFVILHPGHNRHFFARTKPLGFDFLQFELLRHPEVRVPTPRMVHADAAVNLFYDPYSNVDMRAT